MTEAVRAAHDTIIIKKLGESKKMFKKIFKFLKGYVIIKVFGKNSERFVNMCLHNGFDISDIEPDEDGLSMKMANKDFRLVRRIVKKCGVRIKIVKKCGFFVYVGENKQRVMFPLCGILVCIFFTVASQYIWCVEIDGAYDADTDKILEVLRDHGVYVGAPKSKVSEVSEIKAAMLREIDGVNWAWLYTEGAKAKLQLQEIIKAPDVDDMYTPTDIIASRDGYVRSAIVTRGERRVNSGMTVCAGDVLVSGKVPVFKEGYPEKYMYVHSQARIFADTIRMASGDFKSSEELRIKTGSSKKRISLRIFGKQFDLFKDKTCGYAEYDIADEIHDLEFPVIGYSGISLVVSNVYEIRTAEHKLTEDEVLSRARETLETEIGSRLGTGAQRISDELTYSVENGVYKVRLKMNLRENIGVEIPTEE